MQLAGVLVLPLVLGLLVWTLDLPRRLRWRAGDPMAPFRLLALFALPLGLEHLGSHWAEYSELPYIATDALLGLALLVSLILLSCAAEVLEGGKKPTGLPFSPAMWATQIQLNRLFAPAEALGALSDDVPSWLQISRKSIAGLRILSRVLFLVAGGPAHAISTFGVVFFAFLTPAILLGGGITQSGLLGDQAEAPIIGGVVVATGGLLWLLYRKGIPPLGEWLFGGQASDRLARCRRFGGAAFIAYFTLLNMAIGQLGAADALAVSEVETMNLFFGIRSLSDAAAAADLLWPLFVYYSLFYAIAYGIYEALFDPGAEDVAMD